MLTSPQESFVVRNNQPGWWTEPRIALLRSMWAGGSPASLIAEHLGCTRNAVIGKARRLDLPFRKPGGVSSARGATGSLAARIRKPRTNKNAAPRIPEPPPTPLPFLGISLMDLVADQCRFAHGDGPFLFCGQPTQERSSYCAFHHDLCIKKYTLYENVAANESPAAASDPAPNRPPKPPEGSGPLISSGAA